MSVSSFWERVQGRYQRTMCSLFFRAPVKMLNTAPLISFTFDDFPRSALGIGGEILKRHGVRGTYYASLGLMGRQSPVGEIFSRDDLDQLVAEGHELGCHTFGHCHAWNTRPSAFEHSVIENRRALSHLLPGASFATLSYPISGPRPDTKRRMPRHFVCCRGGGQTYNVGVASRTHLSGYFLEQSRQRPESVRGVINENRRAGGWLILATHDVCETPSRFGCPTAFFEEIVRYAVASGARILPVGQAFETITARPPGVGSAPGTGLEGRDALASVSPAAARIYHKR